MRPRHKGAPPVDGQRRRQNPTRLVGQSSKERFEQQLVSAGAGATAPIPERFSTLARAITGSTSTPRLSTGAASRRALAASGKRAATVGRTIHLPGLPDGSPRHAGTMAHELTHVATAHTSSRPVPRFLFDDLLDRDEIAARAVGESVSGYARRSTATTPAPPTQQAGRRGGAAQLPVSAAQGEVVAAATAEATRRMRVELESAVAELSASAEHGRQAAPEAAEPAALGSETAGRDTAADNVGDDGPGTQSAAQDDGSRLDELVEAIEARILLDLERRGGRYAEVF